MYQNNYNIKIFLLAAGTGTVEYNIEGKLGFFSDILEDLKDKIER